MASFRQRGTRWNVQVIRKNNPRVSKTFSTTNEMFVLLHQPVIKREMPNLFVLIFVDVAA